MDEPANQPVSRPLTPPPDPVPIAALPSATSAHMVKCVLLDAGIPAVVVGEHTASTLQHLGSIVSVTVTVQRGDYDRAVAAIDEAVLGAGAPMRCSACGYDLGGLEQQDRCPECGAKYIDLRRRISLAPRPGPPGERSTVATIGAWTGVVMLIGMVVAVVAFVVWTSRH